MTWLNRAADGSVILTLHIQPGAKKTEITGLAAPPVDGKANAALIAFLAKACGVSKSSVELVSGDTSRAKRVRVTGADAATVEALAASSE